MSDETKVEPREDGARTSHRALERLRRLESEKRRLFERLERGERRVRRLARAAWRVQEDERRRLARELHDGVGQTLTALKNELALARRLAPDLPAPAAERLDAASGLAGRALADTRELSRLLRPQILDDLGLEAALAWLLRTLGERSGMETELSARIADGVELSSEHQTLVFRVVQEALSNVERHAEADTVKVRVEAGEGALFLEITDDGRGFDAEAEMAAGAEGSGLRGQRDRLALFGARLRIDSAERGTRLRASVPLDEAGAPDTSEVDGSRT